LSASREPISATSVGFSLGAVAIAPWYARSGAPDWTPEQRVPDAYGE
jgi:hypothetical protein